MRLPNKPTIQVTLFTKTLEASFNNTMSLFYNIDCYYTSGKFPHFKMTPAMHEAVPLIAPFTSWLQQNHMTAIKLRLNCVLKFFDLFDSDQQRNLLPEHKLINSIALLQGN